ncbi:hypothetical protein J7E23_06600 [Pseudomonas sp. ISL-88]|uniref:BclA C-terminal domain-containing protein n=1 Tax=Pseudomonas sp. ISL-88 TaxID=2819169 RepID=UPI001BE635EE|nr:hypothetical protein [Pseudomonas sp. ISL-88]
MYCYGRAGNGPYNDQNLSADITVNAANTVFTIGPAGRYYISYQINLTAGLLVSSRVLISGTAFTSSIIAPVASLANFNNSFIVSLTAGSTIQLQLRCLRAVRERL